jgi:hypothetical protein
MTLREEWDDRLARPASKMVIPRRGVLPATTLSWFGKVTLTEAGTDWPTFDGKLMWPIIQIAPAEAPYVPKGLEDVALLQLFVVPEYWQYWREGEVIRVYESLDDLQAVDEPEHGSEITPTPVAWELVERDLPEYDDLPPDVPREICDAWMDEESRTLQCTKLGGWPYIIQWSPSFPKRGRVSKFEYVCQVGSERRLNWMWGDLGVAHIGRGRDKRDVWSMEWQCS